MPKILLFVFVACLINGLSAQTIEGSFKRTDINDIGVNITFNSDSTFTQTTYQHLGGKLISKGLFSFQGDTLNLRYEAITAPRNIEVKKERMERQLRADSALPLYAKIRMLNKDGSPKPGPMLLLQNKEKELVLGFTTNPDGSFPPKSLHDPYVKYFQVLTSGMRR